jgi:hypothetical protein
MVRALPLNYLWKGTVMRKKPAILLNARCPKCGEPARFVRLVKAKVRCQLLADGKVGPVVSTCGADSFIDSLECGGHHTWKVDLHPYNKPCPDCYECPECHCVVHKGKPQGHHGACSQFGFPKIEEA